MRHSAGEHAPSRRCRAVSKCLFAWTLARGARRPGFVARQCSDLARWGGFPCPSRRERASSLIRATERKRKSPPDTRERFVVWDRWISALSHARSGRGHAVSYSVYGLTPRAGFDRKRRHCVRIGLQTANNLQYAGSFLRMALGIPSILYFPVESGQERSWYEYLSEHRVARARSARFLRRKLAGYHSRQRQHQVFLPNANNKQNSEEISDRVIP
jgi:hypothetical protein